MFILVKCSIFYGLILIIVNDANIINSEILSDKYIEYFFSNYNNLIIKNFKNNNILNFLQYIYEELLNSEDNNYENIIYINKFDEEIKNILNNLSEVKTDYNSIITLKNNYTQNRIFFKKIKIPCLIKNISFYELCILIIIFYISNLHIFNLLNSNFIINKFIFNHLLEYDLTKKYYI